MSSKVRSAERVEFLTDILTGAIESGSAGWFVVHEYRWQDMGADAYAVIESDAIEDDDTKFRIDLDVIARGLGVIRNAVLRIDSKSPNDGEVLHNVKTGERLYLSVSARKNIMLADRTNAEDGDLDVIDYFAIVECGLFGAVVYG